MVQISKKDLTRLAIAFGVADFLSGGKLQAPVGNAARRALVKAGPAIARGIVRYGPTAALTAARVTPTPLAAAATGAVVVQNRAAIADLTRQGYQVVAPAIAQAGASAIDYGGDVLQRALDPTSFEPMGEPRDLLPLGGPIKRPTRKRLSKFNKAVKAGMTTVRNSTSYGKKGTINNARKAFSAVTKVASKVNKGKKVAVKGIQGKIARAVRKIL